MRLRLLVIAGPRARRWPIILVASFLLFASFEGQAQKISLSGVNIPLMSIIAELRKAGFDVNYNPDLLQEAPGFNLEVKEAPVDSFLRICLADTFFWVLRSIRGRRRSLFSKKRALIPNIGPYMGG